MKILFMILCLTSTAFAQVPTISVSEFNLKYNDPSGSASVSYLIVPGYSFESSTTFTVEQQAGSFVLETNNESLTIEDVPKQIIDLKKLIVENLNLETNNSKIFLSVNQMSGNNYNASLDIKSLLVDCKYEHLSPNIKDEVLNSCVNNNGRIKIDKFTNNGKDVVSNADFKFNKNGLNFKIKAAGFNVKGSGKAYYTPGLLRIKVEKAKVGILNVKNKVFKELENIQSQSIRVSNPWIEIDL
jgi:hypothetical protein